MVKAFSLFSVALILCSCSAPTRKTTPAPTTPTGTTTAPIQVTTSDIGIGDIDSQFRLTMILSETNESPNVTAEEIQAKTEVISLVNVTATKPYPKELFLFVKTNSVANFPGHAVKAVVSIFVGDKKADEFRFVYGRDGRAERNNFTIDIMKHLDSIPTSVLVRAEAKLVLYLNTEEETIEGDSPEDVATASAVKLSNPVRVNFF